MFCKSFSFLIIDLIFYINIFKKIKINILKIWSTNQIDFSNISNKYP